ncbi:integral membrane sensor signal transduction histidine kinase [Chthoniobacter flavus Ellin428]|uniref:histidine kinase n=1 Tax=Chthoniobacter flavus Ellin428 TaxID=497964 RepID=B4D071_9BACT|nr:HAMP domain-containing sensor histidine kinase [Chthoniobacter flavus]EDY20385.1 integral membrane sensor signal transduction histidine kinase [Chthoniobacter flavus Ellin428]TCO94275.1 signal transduction histidine kinase [Chthoniobacter flavus]
MSVRRISSLWLRLALPFLLFVVAGSTALALWLHAAAERESRHVFATLARTNADFIKSARLPANERVADYLSRVLNMHVFFRRRAWDMTNSDGGLAMSQSQETIPPVTGPLESHRDLLRTLGPERGIVPAGRDFEAIAVPLENDLSLILVREVQPAWSFLVHTETLALLVAFWVFSVALAWVLASGFVRPLRLLAERLPQIENDPGGALPGAERSDEIGQLARAYLATRAQLAEERTRREQAERLAILGRMATGLAHEIRNPLAAIRMHAQLIGSAHNGDLASTANESLPVLLGEASKIEGLVQQWMFLARPQPPQMTAADLGDIVASVIRTLTPQANHARVRLVNEVPAGLRARVDTSRLAQAIGNVTLNAVQAMPKGGTVIIRGENGASVVLIFQDTGPGFSESALLHHADLFFSEKEGGMGIGMSVTAEILKAHFGKLLVSNAAEGGAVVTMELPVIPTSNTQHPTSNLQ